MRCPDSSWGSRGALALLFQMTVGDRMHDARSARDVSVYIDGVGGREWKGCRTSHARSVCMLYK